MDANLQCHDVVIVGSGAAGLTAAVTAASAGLKTVILEKEALWGGSTALSGGGVWAPGNPVQARAGRQDSQSDVLAYLDEIIPDTTASSSPPRREAFLAAAPDMIAFLEREGLRWSCSAQPDYVNAPHASVGRCLSTRISDGRVLGPWLETLRGTRPPYAIELDEARKLMLGTTSLASTAMMARVFLRDRLNKLTGRRPLSMGASLAGQLMAAAQRRGVEVRLGTPLGEVITESGRATGVIVQTEHGPTRIEARRGVILCAGGFARNPAMRQALQQDSGTYSSASPGDTGDVIALAAAMDAQTEMLDAAWWGTTYMFPGPAPVFCLSERSLPFCLMVDPQGDRFVNESDNYYRIGKTMRERGIETAWMIFDTRHRSRYVFTGMLPGRTPQELVDAGFFIRADSIAELARQCALDAGRLAATISRFNRFAADGVDADFHRGEAPYDRFWSDPGVKPNPCLGAVEKAPFYACRIHPGDLGTKGGFVTDAHARVITADGSPLPGLYASGNCTASVFGRSYPGPGATLGPAMAFGYIAARHLADTQGSGR